MVTQAIGQRSAAVAGSWGVSSYAPALVLVAAAMQVPVGIATATFAPGLADKATAAFFASGAWLTLAHILMLAGVAGLYGTDAVRGGWLKRIAFAVAGLGLAALVLGESVLRVNFDLGNAFFGIASPATALGMVLIGIGTIVSRTWTGWHRYAALICGLYVPVVLIPSFIAAKGPSFIALAGWSCCFLSLGLAMRAEQRA